MSSSIHRDIVDALDRLRTGAVSLTSEQYVKLLDAIEHASSVLHLAPRGSDPVASGVWYHHERGPALAKLADALPVKHQQGTETGATGTSNPADSAGRRHADQVNDDAAVIRALQDSLRSL